jgi:hypothetical protein
MRPRYVLLPEKFFLLVRRGSELGAIRFTRIDSDPVGNGKATYESYFQADGSGSFVTPNVVKRSGVIDIRSMRGIHAFAWQPGQNKLRVGTWWFGCLGPGTINMSSRFAEKDNRFEFAPTSARSLEEIDASDKRLRWFRYEPDARIRLPVSDVPR